MRGKRVAVAICGGQLFELLPHSAFAALIPLFIAEWGLSNAEAGWIGGVGAFGYMLAVPFLGAATDRVDARLVYLGSALVSVVAGFGFAFTAEGFWSALVWRALAGAGHAGMYMPGLRALTDRVDAEEKSRVVVSYTASYSVGVALSFIAAGWIAANFGWPAAFVVAGIGPGIAGLIAALALRPKPPPAPADTRSVLFQFGQVVQNRAALGYILGYGAHAYELMAYRAWTVAFMTFAAVRAGEGAWTLAPTAVAFLVTLCGLPASILGNELAIRIGRRRLIARVMALSTLVALAVGAAASGPYWLILALMIVHAVMMAADSGSLTAGTVGAAKPEQQGATMALHSMVGFGCSFLGPLMVGLMLDATGGRADPLAWFFAFAAMALGGVLGLLALRVTR
jgi:MFS family permease